MRLYGAGVSEILIGNEVTIEIGVTRLKQTIGTDSNR